MRSLSLLCVLVCVTLLYTACSDDEIVVTAEVFESSIAENPFDGQVLGTVSASLSSQGIIRYTLTTSSPAGALLLDSESGVLRVADAALFDFESRSMVTATYTAEAGGVSATSDIIITITDVVNETMEPTLWEGASLTFAKADGADHTDLANQDKLTDRVILTRADQGQIFNIAVNAAADQATSPVGTRWAFGTISDGIETLSFMSFRANGQPKDFPNTPMVLHLIEDNIYVDVTFTSWSQNKNGGFAYVRSTP